MPTLEERSRESREELNRRLEANTLEMGISFTFARYLEQLETYLLQLEQRVLDLEAENRKLSTGNGDLTDDRP